MLVPIGKCVIISFISVDLPKEVNAQMDSLELESVSRKTLEQTTAYVRRFREFLVSKGLPERFEVLPERYLCQYLRYWYSELKKGDGTYYSPPTLICMRAAISRHLTSSPTNRAVDILNSKAFVPANNMLRAMVGKALKEKKLTGVASGGCSAIEKVDLTALSKYFDRSCPVSLQDEVFFQICYHFGFRGREWLRDLKREDVVVQKDAEGREFVDLKRSRLSKNVKQSLQAKEYFDQKSIVMYGIPNNPCKCPVEAIKLYLTKIGSDNNNLFPKPVTKVMADGAWYCRSAVLGKNTLADLMKSISKRAQLSRSYTNHCIRATVVCEMKDRDVPPEDIQVVTGHKNRASVERYAKRISEAKRRKLSDALSSSMCEITSESVNRHVCICII
jgi:hypothetical protein